ncbi:MAG: hypothetical protein QOH34_4195, partial [Mycobacterium sp.]|nr:hypothetical protein [Mycobacterium sp.]
MLAAGVPGVGEVAGAVPAVASRVPPAALSWRLAVVEVVAAGAVVGDPAMAEPAT